MNYWGNMRNFAGGLLSGFSLRLDCGEHKIPLPLEFFPVRITT